VRRPGDRAGTGPEETGGGDAWLVTAADHRRLRAAGALVGDRVEGVPVGVLPQGGRLTVDEIARRPRPVAWKYELLGGVPRIEPKAATVPVRLALAPRVAPPAPPPAGVALRAVTAADAPALVPALAEAFMGNVDFWGRGRADVRAAAEEIVAAFVAGRRGPVHPASRLAATARAVVGGALVVRPPKGPRVDLLFVRPRWQRRGLATALVAGSVAALRTAGEPVLRSRYRLANTPSVAWHARFGFVEEPDLLVASAREAWTHHELQRQAHLGPGDAARRAALEAEARRWARQQRALVARLAAGEDDGDDE
jgi:GNAT superfamily N-acetyltransferase